MRCATCGTHNEPDSRFCGGCGARLAGTVAPTHKIVANPALGNAQPTQPVTPVPTREQQAQAIARQVSADYNAQRLPSARQPAAQRPPSAHDVRRPSAHDVVKRPPSAHDVVQRPPSAHDVVQRPPSAHDVVQRPPSAHDVVQRPLSARDVQRPASAQSQRPSTNPSANPQPAQRPSSLPGASAVPHATPSPAVAVATKSRGSLDESYAVPKRSIALILVVLVFDLGLAAAGVYLLNEGLSTGAASPQDPVSTTGQVAAPPAPAQVSAAKPKPVVALPSPDLAVASAGSGSAIAPAAAGSGSAKTVPAQARKPQRKTPNGAPIDPYAEPPAQPPPGPTLGPESPPRE